MKNTEIIKYIVLVLGIMIFFSLLVVLVNDHINGDDMQSNLEPQTLQEAEEDSEYVSDVFDDTGFGDQNNGSDPFEKYCKGNEGSINSFTVCAPN